MATREGQDRIPYIHSFEPQTYRDQKKKKFYNLFRYDSRRWFPRLRANVPDMPPHIATIRGGRQSRNAERQKPRLAQFGRRAEGRVGVERADPGHLMQRRDHFVRSAR